MPSRRRFSRGYCPLRRTSSDYGSSSRLTLQARAMATAGITTTRPQAAGHVVKSSDPDTADEEETIVSDSSSSDEGQRTHHKPGDSAAIVRRREPTARAKIYRKRQRCTIEYDRWGYVTSLSFDSREGKQHHQHEAPALLPSIAVEPIPVLGEGEGEEVDNDKGQSSLLAFRLNYLLVTVAIMLADGLQGTHLYVLYEGYGYSAASLYCLGFVTGAITSPFTGPLVDRFGRKKSAIIYCALEMAINTLEQYNFIAGLVISRIVGGITTNLLSSVFETWLDAEYRQRGFPADKYELIMRDSVVASNLAAIASGYLAHQLAERLGPVGPFEGAVTCTGVALVMVMIMWTENYGHAAGASSGSGGAQINYRQSAFRQAAEVIRAFRADSELLRVGIIQGCTTGSLQIFIFLWSPALSLLAQHVNETTVWWGLDGQGEPAYGLIFGAFMFAGVLGGVASSWVRRGVTALLSPLVKLDDCTVEVEGEGKIRPMAVEFLAAFCYFLCALLLLTPCIVTGESPTSFSYVLTAFVMYEGIVGIYMPCEGVIRSIYIPPASRGSLLTLPRIIVNIAVALGVASTNFVSLTTAFTFLSVLMAISAVLQLSLVSSREWESLFGRVVQIQKRATRSLSMSLIVNKEKGE